MADIFHIRGNGCARVLQNGLETNLTQFQAWLIKG